jgi:2OG-Fe(II) oxygenase superfamily
MERVATTLMRIFGVGLGMDKHYFDDKIDRHITNFSVLHYPEQPKPPLPGQLRAGAHTDYGSLTILKPDNAPGGLQVQNNDGAWIDVPTLPGTFIINLGDLMAVDQRSLGLDSAPGRQSAARQGGRQPPPVDGILPSAELRRRDRMPTDLYRRRPAATLRQDDVGRTRLD